MVGLETEYIVSFIAARGEPPRWQLLAAVDDAIRRVGRVCEAEQGGYFLANGGAVSFENRSARRDNPVLELATPECKDALEALRYVRSQELFLQQAAAHAERILRRQGYVGRVIFGRGNTDWRGEALGTQENYWVAWRDPWPAACAGALLCAALGAACLLLSGVFFFAAHSVVCAAAAVRRASRRHGVLRQWARARAPVSQPPAARAWERAGMRLLHATVGVAEPLLDLVLLRRLRRELMPFLVTRQVFSGAGALVFGQRDAPLELCARAPRLSRVCGVSVGQRGKAVFDLKPFIRDPLGLLRGQGRLCIAGGDSLMSEAALLLAVGTTSLVLAMIEAGERFPTAQFIEPVDVWREVSAGGPLTRIITTGNRPRSALEIQQIYLARARAFFADAPAESPARQILRLWEAVLECLAENPATLWGQVDWVTKKTLLDGLVFTQGGWRSFGRWGRLLTELRRRLPPEKALGDLDAAGARELLGPRAARDFGVSLDDPLEFIRRRDLFLAAHKLVCRYHEVSRRGGYFQTLRREGDVPALVDRADAQAALSEPPRETRAAIRGRIIALAADPADVRASWERIRVHSLGISVTIRDPLRHLG